jgi:serine O-acetyltransferase
MDDAELRRLYEEHRAAGPGASPDAVRAWVRELLHLLFPEMTRVRPADLDEFRARWDASRGRLLDILAGLGDTLPAAPEELIAELEDGVPRLRSILLEDADAIYDGDPAATDRAEVIRSYPGFLAIAVYRIAHHFHARGVPVLPRILTEWAHARSGIDIHPGAEIGERFCIDHGTGIVIGETTVIGRNVKLYQGVTLGAHSVKKGMARTKRHPTVEDDVVIYANATVLGGDTVVGRGSVIGGSVWLLHSVPPHSRVYHDPDTVVEERREGDDRD